MPLRRSLLALAALLLALAALAGARAPGRPAWAVDAAYRIAVVVDPGDSRPHHTPVGVALDFARIFRDNHIPGRVDVHSLQVVRYDARTGRPGDAVVPPFRSGDFANDDAGTVWWRVPDRSATHYHVYFDPLGPHPRKPPAVVGLVGVGDRFLFNDGRPAPAVPGTFDWDGDGLPDRLYAGVRVYEPGVPLEERLGYAVYFEKNVGTPGHALYAPPYRVRAADGSYLLGAGHLYQNMIPCDWDGAGRLDFIGFRGNQVLLMENTGRRDRNGLWLLKQPRPVLELAESEFRATLPGVLGRPSFYISGVTFADWDGRGGRDMILTVSSYHQTARVDPRQGVVPFGPYLVFYELARDQGRGPDGRRRYARPVVIREERGLPITSTGGDARYVDWDGDGDLDLLLYGDSDRPLEGSRLLWAENVGTRQKPLFIMPVPAPPPHPKTPVPRHVPAEQLQPMPTGSSVASVDWDGDGVPDLLCGSYTDHVVVYRNRGTRLAPVFDRGTALEADGKPIAMTNWIDPQADPPTHWGPQGPAEPTGPCMLATPADWDGDGDLDLFVTGQRWQTLYFENVGTRRRPRLAAGREVCVAGDPHAFAWRCKVAVGDLDGDGRPELVTLSDRDGIFYMYKPADRQPDPRALELRRDRPLRLADGSPLRAIRTDANNNGDNNALLVDWDGDGDLDLLVGSLYGVFYFENVGTRTHPRFQPRGRIQLAGRDLHTFNHAGAFDAADWNGDGRPDLLMGAECPSDQPAGAPLHLFDRTYLDGKLPATKVGRLERR